MNDTTPLSEPAGTGSAPFGSGFFRWLRGLGITRGGDRWFAGVAGGIATRANIDPIIVRGIFVVLAILGSAGLLLYVAGWLLLPDARGRIHLEEVFRGRAGAAAVVAAVAVGLLVVLPVVLRVLGLAGFGGWNLWNALGMPAWLSITISVLAWVAVVTAAILLVGQVFLRHGRNVRTERAGAAADGATPADAATPAGAASAEPPTPADARTWAPAAAAPEAAFIAGPSGPAEYASPTEPLALAAPIASGAQESTETPGGTGAQADPPPSDTTAQPDAATPTFGEQIDDFSRRVSEGAERFGERAGRWGEEVGKQADDWSARYAEQHDRHRLGSAQTVLAMALALLGAGSAALWALGAGWSGASLVTAALLGGTAVLAVSLIIAGVRGRCTGWVGFLAFCGVVALVFTSLLPSGSKFQPFGVMEVSSSDAGAVLIAGSTRIDLEPRGTHDLAVWHLAGNSRITLPADSPVIVRVYLLAGNITAPNAAGNPVSSSGPLLARVIDTRSGSEPAATVTVYMVGGNVKVEERGSSRSSTNASATSTVAAPALALAPASASALAEKELAR